MSDTAKSATTDNQRAAYRELDYARECIARSTVGAYAVLSAAAAVSAHVYATLAVADELRALRLALAPPMPLNEAQKARERTEPMRAMISAGLAAMRGMLAEHEGDPGSNAMPAHVAHRFAFMGDVVHALEEMVDAAQRPERTPPVAPPPAPPIESLPGYVPPLPGTR